MTRTDLMADEGLGNDEAQRRLASALSALPIFPLPGTVFFPHTLLPLHIFELRYRQMTQQVIDGDGYLGIVLSDPAQSAVPVGCARVAGLGVRAQPLLHRLDHRRGDLGRAA